MLKKSTYFEEDLDVKLCEFDGKGFFPQKSLETIWIKWGHFVHMDSKSWENPYIF